MKVAVLLRKFPVLSETFILEQVAALIDQGVEVHIYALLRGDAAERQPLVEDYGLLERTRYPALPFAGIGQRLGGAAKILARPDIPLGTQLRSLNAARYRQQAAFLHLLYLTTCFSGQRYDVVHCHFGMYGLVGVDLRELGLVQGPVLTTFHGMDLHVYPRRWGRGVYRRLFQLGDGFTVNSDFTGQCLVNLGCDPGKITRLPVGLRPALYAPAPRRDGALRVLTVARLTEKKGLEYSIRAVASLLPRFPQLRYEIVGEGELRSQLQSLIHSLKAANHIHLLGRRNQPQLRQLYGQTDIFVLASVTAASGDMEGQGLVLQEAQASGVPVVATRHNGIPEGLWENHTGFLVPERDVAALAKRIAYLAEHPELRRTMGATARRYVQRTFDVVPLTQQLVQLYADLGQV